MITGTDSGEMDGDGAEVAIHHLHTGVTGWKVQCSVAQFSVHHVFLFLHNEFYYVRILYFSGRI